MKTLNMFNPVVKFAPDPVAVIANAITVHHFPGYNSQVVTSTH